MSKHGRIARASFIGLGTLLLLIVTFLMLQLFEGGRVFTVRSYVRLERAWTWYFPFDSGRGGLRRLEPYMFRVGVLRPVRVELEPGVSLLLDPSDVIARSILRNFTSQWEPKVWEAISGGLSEGSVFLDVGAHIGYDALKASVRVGDNGRVVAFEPNPNTLAALRSNIDASGARNVIVQPIACTDIEQTVTLFDSTLGGNSGSSSLSQRNAGPVTRSYTVRGRPVDDVFAELGLKRLDVFKADVEGAELLVLRGAAQTLKRFHPKLILEIAPHHLANMGTSVEELESFIGGLGYNATRTVDLMNREWTVAQLR